MSWITITFAHKKRHVNRTLKALDKIIELSVDKPWKEIKY